MDLYFHPSKGKPFWIEIGYFDTVYEIKEKVLKYQSIPISTQTLLFNGVVLDDNLNIHHSDILDRSHIHVLIAPDQSPDDPTITPLSTNIQLRLKTPSSKLGIALEMDLADTIARIKDKIHDMDAIPTNRLVVHINGVELPDHRSLQECGLSNNSEVDVAVRPAATQSRVASGNSNGGSSRKLRINVVAKCGGEGIPVEVNPLENVGELRKTLEKKKLELPQEGYFFIYKQNVMDDDRTFRWHHVCQGDSIEIFGGSISGGS